MRPSHLVLAALLVACGGPPGPAATPPPAAGPPPASATEPTPPPLPALDLAALDLAADGCLVLRDLATGAEQVSDAARCARPRRPNSTFKIVNALVALDLGLLADADSLLRYDRATYPPEAWWPSGWAADQPLATAIRISAVPLFRGLARAIGPERMAASLERLDYGNRDLSAGVDAFWLEGPMRITAHGQVELLARLVRGTLPVSAGAQEVVRAILRRDDAPPGLRHAGKTGSGSLEDTPGEPAFEGPFVGWMVGWVELPTRTVVYALWLEGPSFESMRDRRTRVVDRLLATLAALDGPPRRSHTSPSASRP